MNFSKCRMLFFLCFFGASYCLHLAAQQKGIATALAEPHHKGNFSAVTSGGWKYWDKDYLVTWAQSGTSYDVSPDKPAVMLYDRDGNAKEAYFWLEGASRVGVDYAAVTKSGKVLISGGARTKEGLAAFYIAEIVDGRPKRIIRTTPFAPVYICEGEADTVWAYGFERNDEGDRVPAGPMLRQFSFDKGQLKAMLLISDLAPGWNLPEGSYLGEVNMRCTPSTVGIYNARSSEWVQFDVKTNTLRVAKVDPLPPPSKMRITGFAFTDSGDVFASFHDRSKSLPMSGLFQLAFDSGGNGKWVFVPGTVGPYRRGSPIEKLMGTDGTSLVHTRSVDGNIYWSKYSNQ